MILTTRQLNKKLKEKLLRIEDAPYMRNTKVRVIRARQQKRTLNYPSTIGTLVTIQICAEVKCTRGDWLNLHEYGPRHIRNFIRKDRNKVKDVVSKWVRLWGFPTTVKLENIVLIN